MPTMFCFKHKSSSRSKERLIEKQLNSSDASLSDDALTGTHKVTFCPNQKWDFEGSTKFGPIDVNLVMPPHRPRLQPENHRSSMLVSSTEGPIKVKICRYALHRAFFLRVNASAHASSTIWVPSNFEGFITISPNVRGLSFSAAFVEHVLPYARIKTGDGVPSNWTGDEVRVDGAPGTQVVFRVWNVLSRTSEPEHGNAGLLSASSYTSPELRQHTYRHIWRRMLGCIPASASSGGPLKRLEKTQNPQLWNWDFLIEDVVDNKR